MYVYIYFNMIQQDIADGCDTSNVPDCFVGLKRMHQTPPYSLHSKFLANSQMLVSAAAHADYATCLLLNTPLAAECSVGDILHIPPVLLAEDNFLCDTVDGPAKSCTTKRTVETLKITGCLPPTGDSDFATNYWLTIAPSHVA